MAGLFEIYVDTRARYRFRLLVTDRRPLAEASSHYRSKSVTVDAVTAVREAAASGHVVDLCSHGRPVGPSSDRFIRADLFRAPRPTPEDPA